LLCGLGELSNSLDAFLQAEDYLQAALELASTGKVGLLIPRARRLTLRVQFYPLLAAINFQLGCTSVTSDLPIRAGTYFCSHLEALLYKFKETSVTKERVKGKADVKPEDLPWQEVGRSCFEIGKLVGNLEQKELGMKFLTIAINSLDEVFFFSS